MDENRSSNHWMPEGVPCIRMCGGRGCRIFCGIFFIVMGLFWLGKKADWFPPEVITLFWPVALIAAGVFMIGAALIKQRRR